MKVESTEEHVALGRVAAGVSQIAAGWAITAVIDVCIHTHSSKSAQEHKSGLKSCPRL